MYTVYGVLMDPDLSADLVAQCRDCPKLDGEWQFVSKLRLENGNKLLKESGRRVYGERGVTQFDPRGTSVGVLLLNVVAVVAALCVAWTLFQHYSQRGGDSHS